MHVAGANRYASVNDVLNYYNLSSFRTSLYCAGLSNSIAQGQPTGITIFAPTNAAFSTLLTKQNMTMKVRFLNCPCTNAQQYSEATYINTAFPVIPYPHSFSYLLTPPSTAPLKHACYQDKLTAHFVPVCGACRSFATAQHCSTS